MLEEKLGVGQVSMDWVGAGGHKPAECKAILAKTTCNDLSMGLLQLSHGLALL